MKTSLELFCSSLFDWGVCLYNPACVCFLLSCKVLSVLLTCSPRPHDIHVVCLCFMLVSRVCAVSSFIIVHSPSSSSSLTYTASSFHCSSLSNVLQFSNVLPISLRHIPVGFARQMRCLPYVLGGLRVSPIIHALPSIGKRVTSCTFVLPSCPVFQFELNFFQCFPDPIRRSHVPLIHASPSTGRHTVHRLGGVTSSTTADAHNNSEDFAANTAETTVTSTDTDTGIVQLNYA